MDRPSYRNDTLPSSPSSTVRGITARSKVSRGQNKCISIHIKDTLKNCHIPPDQLEVLAAYRDTWRATCKHGLAIFRSNHTVGAENMCGRRHAVSTSSSGPTCHISYRVCVSDFGLCGHLRSHAQQTPSGTASSS